MHQLYHDVSVNYHEKAAHEGSTRAQERLNAAAHPTPAWVGKATLPRGWKGQEKPSLPASAQPWDEIPTAQATPCGFCRARIPLSASPARSFGLRACCCAHLLWEPSTAQTLSLAAEFTDKVSSYFSAGRNTPLYLRIYSEIKAC